MKYCSGLNSQSLLTIAQDTEWLGKLNLSSYKKMTPQEEDKALFILRFEDLIIFSAITCRST